MSYRIVSARRVIAAILTVIVAISIHRVEANVCVGKDGSYFPVPNQRNKFIQCAHGIEYTMSCGAGTVFNPKINVCDYPYNVKDDQPSPVDHNTADVALVNTNRPATITSRPVITGSQCQRRVCYYTNWSQYRPTPATKYLPGNIDASLCTHIMYAFAKIEFNRLVEYEWNDAGLYGNYGKVVDLKLRNPNLKVLIAVGGWNMGSQSFTAMVDNEATRSQFIRDAIQFIREHRFDGLDLDWEYPANRGSPASDKQKFTLLVEELRQAFEREATGPNKLILTAAVGTGKNVIDTAYEIPSIARNLDFINLMTYDFHGSWEQVTGHVSPLYAGSYETGIDAYLNLEWAANYWVQQGAPKNKLVIGMSFYGRSFTLSSSNDGVGSAATIGAAGPYTRESGVLSYYEVCELIARGAKKEYLQDQRVPYIVSQNQWVGYEDVNSLREKVRFARNNGFGGVMIWSLDMDDFGGRFCGQGVNPLLTAVNDECTK